MATSLLGFGLLLHGGTALAQSSSPYPVVDPQPPAKTLQFHRDALPANPPPPVYSVRPVSAQVKDAAQGQQQEKPYTKANYDIMAEFRGVREVPGLERLTLLETESEVFARMKQEALKTGERIEFPEEPILSKEAYPGRHWAAKPMIAEPSYVVHGRLYFEQKNFERGLWDFGPITPAIQMGEFFLDVALLPYNCGTRPCEKYDTSAGKCLPCDPTPFMLYPIEWSMSGAVFEAAAITGLLFTFP